MKKLLSVVLALLMLAVMLPVTAMAEDIPTLENGVWKNVDSTNVQDVLDGRYGSIDNTTIVLTAGTYGQLELGRATKYPGSNTQYMVGGFDESAANYQKFNTAEALKTYEEENHWSPNCHYIRSMSNVTIKAAAGAEVKVAGLFASSGHIYQNSTDYVLDKAVQGGMHTYYLAQKMSNITIEGITFTAKTDINTSIPETTINGFTFKNCTFNIGSIDDNSDYIALRYYNENNNGNLTDLTVENCKFNSCRQGVYTSHIKNVTVKGCTFDTTGHNAIAIQDFKGTCDHGNVVITGNTFKNVGDRIIRFNNVGEGTTITISNNTSVNSGASNGEIIKATTLPEGMEVTMTNDNWGKVGDKDPVIGNGFIETTTGGTIVIVPDRTEDTPKTEPEKNPTTGANDMVAAAAALMAVSALGMAVLSRKK
ncbi:MAG: right-handed parallel beta-helix repeat-containing protein [Angelakisella sp.]|mgnify:CR=1 FL=1|nr:right-handed parallel beta-helix repeat-containing protein [Angelakisella sp.]